MNKSFSPFLLVFLLFFCRSWVADHNNRMIFREPGLLMIVFNALTSIQLWFDCVRSVWKTLSTLHVPLIFVSMLSFSRLWWHWVKFSNRIWSGVKSTSNRGWWTHLRLRRLHPEGSYSCYFYLRLSNCTVMT